MTSVYDNPTITFTGPFTEDERLALAQAVQPFTAEWCFEKDVSRRQVMYRGWQPIWEGIEIGGKSPRPFEYRSVNGIVVRLGLLAEGKKIIRGNNEQQVSVVYPVDVDGLALADGLY